MKFEIQTIHRVQFSCTTNGDAADDYNDALVKLAREYRSAGVGFDNDSRYTWKWRWVFECRNKATLTDLLKRADILAIRHGVELTNETL